MKDTKEFDFGSKYCICSKCGYKMQHAKRGVPCNQKKCPKCGSKMMGEQCTSM